jgi:hypothetical protein
MVTQADIRMINAWLTNKEFLQRALDNPETP